MQDGIAQGRGECGEVCQGLGRTLWQLDHVESEFVEVAFLNAENNCGPFLAMGAGMAAAEGSGVDGRLLSLSILQLCFFGSRCDGQCDSLHRSQSMGTAIRVLQGGYGH